MYPCGKCEKCRRIIGMIKALGENPGMCGYNQEQISNGLSALAKKSVKQIGSDAAHLYALLLENKLIEENDFTRKVGKKHPEIMKLRFDQERSNLEDLPNHIRAPLFNIFKEYAEGAVQRINNKWIEINVNDEYLNQNKYRFDSPENN
jgi:hypothetical protein